MDILNDVGSILMVVVGLGFVIFFHELGHFALAKLNKVKVERFFVGFDPWGLRICQFKYGETTYGIGALPLGGYVSMLGEHTGEVGHESEDAQAAADPRAFGNRPVGARMSILVAGVVMNAILGWALYASTYLIGGVREIPGIVGGVGPGSPAYVAGIEPGDTIVAVDGERGVNWDKVRNASILSGRGQKVVFDIQRSGVSGELRKVIEPRRADGEPAPTVGVANVRSLTLDETTPFLLPTGAGMGVEGPKDLAGGDTIVKAGVLGEPPQPLADALAFRDLSARNANRPLTIEVDHAKPRGKAEQAVKTTVATLPPVHMLDLGLNMEIGPILGVRPDSPAARAGFLAGDVIVKVDGKSTFDPLRLPEQAAAHAGQPWSFEVQRTVAGSSSKELKTLIVTPDDRPARASMTISESALEVEPLGIAYEVRPVVASVPEGSPATGKIKPGARILSARFPAPAKRGKETPEPVDLSFDEPGLSWVGAFEVMQQVPAGDVVLTLDGQPSVTLVSAPVADWYSTQRGLVLEAQTRILPPQGFARSARLAYEDTTTALLSMPRMIQSLFQGRVSRKGLAGPIGIFRIGKNIAAEGIIPLMRFLAMLSLNLAALNILPIPPLDGGQLLLLVGEKINGKPLPEAIAGRFVLVGLVLVLTLMVFTLGQDLHLTYLRNFTHQR